MRGRVAESQRDGVCDGMNDLPKKVRRLRLSLGLNQSEFADIMRVTQGSVSRWENGSLPDAVALSKLAELAGTSVQDLLAGEADSPFLRQSNILMVKGAVAAGVFKEAMEWPESEWFAYIGGSHIQVDPKRRFGLKVEGESMNELYPHGTILDCVSVFDSSPPRSGQHVIVLRSQAGDGVEATVKEFILDQEGRYWLVPRSNHPAFQAPIPVDDPNGGDDDEVRIIAVVVGSYRPEPF